MHLDATDAASLPEALADMVSCGLHLKIRFESQRKVGV
jgi:hypothetical protein